MELWQKLLTAAVVIALIALTVLTWGSIGSMATAFCLLYLIAAYIFKRCVTDRDGDDYQME